MAVGRLPAAGRGRPGRRDRNPTETIATRHNDVSKDLFFIR
jgi:hypothetical protein